MCWSEVQAWQTTATGRRGAAYADLKAAKAEACIRFVSSRIPELRNGIESLYTSTPLTYRSFLNAVEGAAYGIRKDCNAPMFTVLAPRTPVPNLFLTGQNLNLHGLLGVSLTSFLTCAGILGRPPLAALFQ
jgi:all-trans-retinol 13,14-reductase